MIQKYWSVILTSLLSLIILTLSITVDVQYRELNYIKSSIASSCDDSIRYSSDSIIIANFIKGDTTDEEIIRKCDRIIEYMNRNKELAHKTKEMLFNK